MRISYKQAEYEAGQCQLYAYELYARVRFGEDWLADMAAWYAKRGRLFLWIAIDLKARNTTQEWPD